MSRTRRASRRFRGANEERAVEKLGPEEQTDARDVEAEHVVRDRRQVRSPGGRRGGQVGGRQVMNAGKSHMDAVEQSGKSAGEAYMQG